MSKSKVEHGNLEVVQVEKWDEYSWLRHGFSSRGGGDSIAYTKEGSIAESIAGSTPGSIEGTAGQGELNLGFGSGDDAATVAAHRLRFLRAVAPEVEARLMTVRQVHSAKVKVVRAGEAAGVLAGNEARVTEADGLITGEPGLLLGILVADCVPVLVADVKKRVVAAFHAGWRGTVAGIVMDGIKTMREEYGCEPEDLVGAVGPSIGACCYTVGEEVRTEFGAKFEYAAELFRERGRGWALDLWEANRRQMVGAGMHADRVTVVGECTACTRVEGRRKYFSYRAEGGVTGRAMGVIGTVGEEAEL